MERAWPPTARSSRPGGRPTRRSPTSSELFSHVVAQDASAATSLQTFTGGVGDVLISYENEAIAAKAKGKDVDWVVPDATILIENPVAVTTRSANAAAAKAFVDFLRTKPAQEIFAKYGYRPVVDGVTGPYAFPTPKQLFTIADLGGWTDVSTRFFDPKAGLIVPDREGGGGRAVADLPLAGSDRAPRGAAAAPRGGVAAAGRGTAALATASTVTFLSVVVLLPIAALLAAGVGPGFLATVTEPEAVAALDVHVGVSLVAVAVDLVAGLAVAWVLVRDDFPRPPASSTRSSTCRSRCRRSSPASRCWRCTATGARSGSTSRTRRAGVALALLFVTLPFVVRSVQPVLADLDPRDRGGRRHASARGSWTTFRRVAAADAAAGARHRRRPGLRACARRVRVGRADLGQPAVPDGGRLLVDLHPGRERRRRGRRRCRRRPARRGARGRRRLRLLARRAARATWRDAGERPASRCGSPRWATWG